MPLISFGFMKVRTFMSWKLKRAKRIHFKDWGLMFHFPKGSLSW